MIIRNAITPELEDYIAIDPGYAIQPEDYEEGDIFFTKYAIDSILQFYGV